MSNKKTKTSKRNNEKNNKNKVKVIGIIVLVLIGLSVCGFFGYKYYSENKLDNWGQTYYVYLKNAKKNPESAKLDKNMENAQLKFIDLKNQDDPAMVITYKKNKQQYTNVYYIQNNVVNTFVFEENTNIEFLYNIEKDEYDYYAHTDDEENDYYDSLTSQIEEKSEDEETKEIEPDYTFPKEETKEGELSDFDEKFIDPDIKDEYVDFDYDKIKDNIKESSENYQPQEELITEEIEEEVKTRKEEVIKIIEEKRNEEIFDNLIGIWYYPKDNIIVEFSYYKKNKYFTWGFYATEVGFGGTVQSIEYDGSSIYKFVADGTDISIDISDAANKKIKIKGNTYYFMGKDASKAYDAIFYKYLY